MGTKGVDHAPKKSRREQLIEASPGIILAPLLYFWLPSSSFFESAITAVVGAAILQGCLFLAYVFICLEVSRWKRDRSDPNTLVVSDYRVVGAMLMGVGLLVLGQVWAGKRVDKIADCVEERMLAREPLTAANAQGVIRYCSSRDEGDYYYDDY